MIIKHSSASIMYWLHNKTICTYILLSLVSFPYCLAQDESDFYTETNQLGISKNLVTDYGAIADDEMDDSSTLQSAIDELTALTNGGRIYIPAGTFIINEVVIKSNVHIEIDNEAIIKPPVRTDSKNYAIFRLSKKNTYTQNISIRGVGGKFSVNLRGLMNKNVRVFQCGYVENFLISDFHILDDDTKFSVVTAGIEEFGDTYEKPKNGVVKNGSQVTGHYGYGLVQTQAGDNILFKNLAAEGGITLRMETGWDFMNAIQIGGLSNIYGRNIHCEDGNAAVMISPHAMHNGYVDIDSVSAINCGFAVRIASGYLKDSQQDLGITPGSFSDSSKVQNVMAIYGDSAQVKPRHYRYTPCELRPQTRIPHPDDESFVEPSISAVLNEAHGTGPGYYNVDISNVEHMGFLYQSKLILYDTDGMTDADCTRLSTYRDRYVSIVTYPNPVNDVLHIELPENVREGNYYIFDMTGRMISMGAVPHNSIGDRISIYIQNLESGMYVLKVNQSYRSTFNKN